MAINENDNVGCSLIQKMIKAREVSAVLKSQLAALRSFDPDVCVIAFEGIDDKTVYYHWIKQIAPNFVYEPFVCKGKVKVLQLKKMLEQDLCSLSSAVLFVIDRDYDDLCGHEVSEKLFMTDSYSFENYLVNERVLDELLKNELHCHGEPACRSIVLKLFQKQYINFLNVTSDLNFRIFVSRKCAIHREKELPKTINRVAKVSIFTIDPAQEAVCAQVVLEREPTGEESNKFKDDFVTLDPVNRYRGKFALMFFCKWLELLAVDRNDASSKLFTGMDRDGLVARRQFTLDSMAARAPHPPGLREFVLRVA